MVNTKEEMLRKDGSPWADPVRIHQDPNRTDDFYRNSLASVWMQELQRRIDVLIAAQQKKKPGTYEPQDIHGVQVKLPYLFMGLTPKGRLLLKGREELSGDTISKSRSRILRAAGVPERITGRNLRSACVNMLYYLAVVEREYMSRAELQKYIRHKEDGKTRSTINTNYIAPRLCQSVYDRWTMMTAEQRKAIVTHSCFTRV